MAGYETLGRFTWQGIRPWGDLLGRVLDPGEIYLAVYQALGNLLAMVSDPGDYCFCNFFYSLESDTSVIQIFKLTNWRSKILLDCFLKAVYLQVKYLKAMSYLYEEILTRCQP